MRYIGGKSLLTDHILGFINQHTNDVRSVTDIFAGSGAVAQVLKREGYEVNANDLLYFSYVINKGMLEMHAPLEGRTSELLEYLNNLPINEAWTDLQQAFIYQNYSPHEGCERMYFQCGNALKIDVIRQEIERLKPEIMEGEYFYLLASLICAVPYVSNITGTYGAYLKYWDKRTFNPIRLEHLPLSERRADCRCFNMDALELASQITSDLVYLDPPYNGRQYLPNYHLLETIARYDNPVIHGVTGMRKEKQKMSDFCKKTTVEKAFRELFSSLDTKYILVSYNNEGLLSTHQLSDLVREAGKPDTFRLLEIDYRRYKNKIPNNNSGLKEQLYYIER